MTPEGLIKRLAMKRIPAAQRRQLTIWLTETQYDLMRSAAMMQKSGRGKKSSSMSRNIGFEIKGSPDNYHGLIGTGVNKTMSIKYAQIHDKGGTITAKKKYLTIPFDGVLGKARSFKNTFVAKGPSGGLVMFQKQGKGKNASVIPLFFLKRSVTLPATGWFSKVIVNRYQDLQDMMSPEAVLAAAEKMGGANA